jgi:hypothetical protein
LQVLKVLQNIVTVLYPAVIFTGNNDATVSENTHDKQDRDGGAERE